MKLTTAAPIPTFPLLSLTVYGHPVETVTHFQYLGRVIACDGTSTADITHRIQTGKKLLAVAKPLLKDKMIRSKWWIVIQSSNT